MIENAADDTQNHSKKKTNSVNSFDFSNVFSHEQAPVPEKANGKNFITIVLNLIVTKFYNKFINYLKTF